MLYKCTFYDLIMMAGAALIRKCCNSDPFPTHTVERNKYRWLLTPEPVSITVLSCCLTGQLLNSYPTCPVKAIIYVLGDICLHFFGFYLLPLNKRSTHLHIHPSIHPLTLLTSKNKRNRIRLLIKTKLNRKKCLKHEQRSFGHKKVGTSPTLNHWGGGV